MKPLAKEFPNPTPLKVRLMREKYIAFMAELRNQAEGMKFIETKINHASHNLISFCVPILESALKRQHESQNARELPYGAYLGLNVVKPSGLTMVTRKASGLLSQTLYTGNLFVILWMINEMLDDDFKIDQGDFELKIYKIYHDLLILG